MPVTSIFEMASLCLEYISAKGYSLTDHAMTPDLAEQIEAVDGRAQIGSILSPREYEDAAEFMDSIGITCAQPADMYFGAVVGIVDVVDVVSQHSSPWFFGPRGLVLENVRSTLPVPVNGALGYFDWQKRRLNAFPARAKWMQPKHPKTEPIGSLL